jgi:hypothetical protein
MAFRVMELVMEDGASPFRNWFIALDAVAAAKVTTAIFRMQQGNLSNVKWFRGSTKRAQQSEIDRAVDRWLAYKRRKVKLPPRR